jgi:hypothetical protein
VGRLVEASLASRPPNFLGYVALIAMAALLCEECGREMAVEFRIPRLGAPGLCHEFYSCDCGFVTSQKHADSHALQMAEREVGKIRLRLDKDFLRWARLANKVTAPPVPPKLID